MLLVNAIKWKLVIYFYWQWKILVTPEYVHKYLYFLDILFSSCRKYLRKVLLFLSGRTFTSFCSSAAILSDSALDGAGWLTNSSFWPHLAQFPLSATQGIHNIWYADLIRLSEHLVHFAGCVSGLYLPYLQMKFHN